MPVVTTFTCDQCKAPQQQLDHLTEISVVTQRPTKLDPVPVYQRWNGATEQRHAFWCQECTNRAGLRQTLIPGTEVPPPMTIEDIIREIVQTEMENR